MKRLLPIVGSLLLTSTAALAADPITYNTQSSSATTASAYWTPDRLNAAVPRERALKGEGRAPTWLGPQPTPGTAGAAGGTVVVPLPPAAKYELQRGAVQPTDGAYPGPNTTFGLYPGPAHVPYVAYPYSTIGRLFFTEPGAGDFVCSAATTYGGAALNVVWTAGHCVAGGANNKKFFTNWLFCPAWNAKQGGVNPQFGCWTWAYATTTNAWFNQSAFTRDYAVVGMAPTGTKLATNVVSAVGGLGFAWNWGRDQHWTHIGYPAASPYDGGYMIRTEAEHRYDDVPDLLGPPTNSWGSPQTPGASGSPGMLFWSQDGGYINTDTSYYYLAQAGFELQGPYYDTNVCNFWKSATGWGGTC